MSVMAFETRRRVVNGVMCGLLVCSLLLALVPLVSVLTYVAGKGIDALSLNFLTHSMNGVGPLDTTGGVYHAMLGTLVQVGLAALMTVPLGIAVAVYIAEVGRGRLATATRFIVDVMTGVPSIVAGLFIFAFWVVGLNQGFSGFAASLSLAILMLPVIIRSSEEMLKLVPMDLREASYALGVSQWRTVFSVVLPAAASGITTGVMLSVARVTGETAPLLLTAFGYDAIKANPFDGPQSALPLFVFSQAGSAFEVSIRRAWAGALTLIAIVLILTFLARLVSRRNLRMTQ
jgi:phosphate transport system permease protein